MIVIADTTPLNYLVLIDQSNLLPRLYGRVLIPSAVYQELQAEGAPASVRDWAARRNLTVIGTLRVLEDAAQLGLIDLPHALQRLQQTTSRASAKLLQAMLDRNEVTRKKR